MKCPWSYSDQPLTCSAVEGLVIVNETTPGKYCINSDFSKCPLYKYQKLNGKLISFDEFRLIETRRHELKVA